MNEINMNFSDLSAIFLNCTLKKTPELSHTEGLMKISRAIMEKNGKPLEKSTSAFVKMLDIRA